MTQTYPKPWKSYQEQLDQLIELGMIVTDNARTLDYLERIGYYRLSGYWFAFRERTELRVAAILRKRPSLRDEAFKEEIRKEASRQACPVTGCKPVIIKG